MSRKIGEPQAGPRKVLVVTGASRGIGAATARLAATQRYDVCVNYRTNLEKAGAVVAGIENNGGRALAVQADVSNEQDIKKLFDTVKEALGTPDALVNCAGIVGQREPLENIDLHALENVFATNTLGTILCTREAVRLMSTTNGGRGGAIVNVSSEAARFGGTNLTPYAASKAAINTFTLGTSREIAEKGVRINTVSPGVIDTDQFREMDETNKQRLISSIPIGRVGDAVEVAQAILWLLSDEASYVTGITLPVHGGR